MEHRCDPAIAAEHAALRSAVAAGAGAVAVLGGWAERADAVDLAGRLATVAADGTVTVGTGGFDAGIAVALGLIPAERATVAARLHANYDVATLTQVRAEAADLDPDADTTWWLAACSVCDESPSTPESVRAQLDAFRRLATDPAARRVAAAAALADMRAAYRTVVHHRHAAEPLVVAAVDRDGGAQGAYIDGIVVSVQHSGVHDIFFVGTPLPSLGFDTSTFAWEDPPGPGRRSRSGPVGGSAAYVKAASRRELDRVLDAVRIEPA